MEIKQNLDAPSRGLDESERFNKDSSLIFDIWNKKKGEDENNDIMSIDGSHHSYLTKSSQECEHKHSPSIENF